MYWMRYFSVEMVETRHLLMKLLNYWNRVQTQKHRLLVLLSLWEVRINASILILTSSVWRRPEFILNIRRSASVWGTSGQNGLQLSEWGDCRAAGSVCPESLTGTIIERRSSQHSLPKSLNICTSWYKNSLTGWDLGAVLGPHFNLTVLFLVSSQLIKKRWADL